MFGKGQARWQDALKLPYEKARARFQEFVEGATHRQRFAAAVGLGRAAVLTNSEGARARELVAGMRQGGFADRYLALNTCYGSHDTAQMLESVSDRSETLRAIARSMISIYGSDDQVLKTFDLSARLTRKSFVKQLNKRKRLAVVDQILAGLLTTDPNDFAALLPYGSTDYVQAHWPGIEDDCTEIEWQRLARNKQEYAQQRITALVDSTPEFDPRVRTYAVAVLGILAKARCSGAMTLVHSLLRIFSLSQIAVPSVMAAFPSEMAKLVLDADDRISISLFRTFSKIKDHDLLVALMRQYPPSYGIVQILKKLSVVAREKVYDELSAMWRSDGDGVIEEAILELMPAEVRIKEARAHLAMESLATHLQIRMIYAAFLPWQEVGEALKPYIHDPDAQIRSVAWSSLIAALRYNRDQLAEVLDQIKQRKREQDPVKQTIFESLANLPPSMFKTDNLADLAVLIQDTLDSKDLSGSTAYSIEDLLLSMMPFHPEWAAKQVAHYWRERGRSANFGPAWHINDQQALQIEAQIAPVLKQWNRKEYESFVLTAASLLGDRLKVTKEITKLLREIVLDGGQYSSNEDAFDLLRTHAFETLGELIPLMLQKDSSWGTKQDIVNYLLRYRQDLLSPYLGTKKHKGRFHGGKNCVVPSLSHSAVFLSSGQQKVYADALNSMATHDDSRRYENLFVITNLAKIPDFPIKYLTQFLKRPAEAQIAIQAMAQLDEGNGVPLLVEALDDPALASAAIYALRTCLMKMSPKDAFSIIQRAPRNQVTVYKEVLRLLGDIKSDEAFAELLSTAKQDLHRDVRIALIFALRNHLDRSETWTILQEAVNDPEAAVANTAIRTPANRLSVEGRASLLSLLLGGLNHSSPRVRLKTLERLCDIPVPDADMALLDVIIATLGSGVPEECRRAATALMSMYAHKSLIAVPKAAVAVMPKRLNLRILIECIEAALQTQRSKLVPATYATIATLEQDSLTMNMRVRLAVASMPWTELTQWLKELDAKKMVHPDALQEVGSQLLKSVRPDFDRLVELELELRNADSDVLKRIALYSLEAQSGRLGWNAERLERLEGYRRDSSAYISEIAQFILPEAEEALKTLQSQQSR